MASVCGSEAEDETDEEADDTKDFFYHSGVVRNHKYNNWLKAAEGLVLLKQGLAPFVDREIHIKHTLFLNKVPSRKQGTSSCDCTFKNILPDHDISTCSLQKCLCKEKTRRRRKCPQNICSTFLQMILREHKTGDPLWKNSDINLWPTDHWSVAKCYMTTPTSGSSAQMTDASGLLSVIINATFFQTKVTSQPKQPGDVFLMAKDMRNYIFHHSKMELTDTELQDILDTFVAVLKDPASLLHDQDACLAVKLLESLRKDELKLTSVEEREILYQRTEALKQLIQGVEEAKSEAVEKVQETGSGVLESIDARIEILNQRSGELKQMIQGAKDARSEAVESVEGKTKQVVGDISRLKEQTLLSVQETGSGVLESIDERRNIVMEDLNKFKEFIQNVNYTDSGAVKWDAATVQRQIEEIDDRLRNIEAKLQAGKDLDTDGGDMPDKEQKQLNTKLSAIRRQLASLLWNHYTTTSLSPLKTKENDIRIDEVYTEPAMEIEEKATERDTDKTNNRLKVEKLSDIFKTQGTRLKRIYVLGEIGTGKTTFCQMLISKWCNSKSIRSHDVSELMEMMKEFDFVFYLPLKMLLDQHSCNLREMIKWYYKYEVPEEMVDYIMLKLPDKCLILADGLDEWKPSFSERRRVHVTYGIPDAEDVKDVTLITTSRPSAIGVLNMKSTEYDRKIILSGIKDMQTMAHMYCAKMKAESKKDVLKRLNELQVKDIERMPLILKQIVWLLRNGFEIAPGISGLYSAFVTIAMKWCYDKYQQENKEPTTVGCIRSRFSELKLPKQLGKVAIFQDFQNLVFSLSQIAFEMLIMDSNQMFGRSKLRNFGVCDNEINSLLVLGLLSEENFEYPMEENTQFCFPHISFMDYFSAVFIASHVQSDQTSTGGDNCHPESIDPLRRLFEKCRSIEDVLPLKTVLKFVCGLAPPLMRCVCQDVYKIAQSDEQYFRDRFDVLTNANDVDLLHLMYSHSFGRNVVDVQCLVADCVTECKTSGHSVGFQIPVFDLIVGDKSYLDIHEHVEGQSVQNLYVYMADVSTVQESQTSAFLVDCSQFPHLRTVSYDTNKPSDSYLQEAVEEQFLLRNLEVSNLENLLMAGRLIPKIQTGVQCESLKHIAVCNITLRLHSEISSLLNVICHTTTLCSITLYILSCLECNEDCDHDLDLSKHYKLQTLCLKDTPKINIKGINKSNLEYVTFKWCFAENVRNLRSSQKLKNLSVEGFYPRAHCPELSFDFTKEMNEDICTCIKLQYLKLVNVHIQDDALQLHSGMGSLSHIELWSVSMSESTFITLVESLLSLRQSVKVTLKLWDDSLRARCWSYIRNNPEYFQVTSQDLFDLSFETVK